MQGLCGFVVRDEDKRRRRRDGLNEEWQVKRAGCEGQARDAAPALAGFKVSADAIVGVGVFEVREKLANERQDHEALV